MNRKVILASKSPRRKQLLEQIEINFEVRESGYEEDMTIEKDPYELAKILALKKAQDVACYYNNEIIVAADTFVICDNDFLGKPKNEEEARQMLKRLSGREHKVITGFAIIDTRQNKVINDFGEAIVKFWPLSDKQIDDYIATGEPLDKAGSYGVQKLGAVLIESIKGDYYSVVGLPIGKIYYILREMDIY